MTLTLILSIISAFSPLLQGFIGTAGESLIQVALSAIASLITAFQSGNKATSVLTASLAALQAVLTALQASNVGNATVEAQIAELDKMLTEAISAFENVETTGVNPGALVIPPPVQ